MKTNARYVLILIPALLAGAALWATLPQAGLGDASLAGGERRAKVSAGVAYLTKFPVSVSKV